MSEEEVGKVGGGGEDVGNVGGGAEEVGMVGVGEVKCVYIGDTYRRKSARLRRVANHSNK